MLMAAVPTALTTAAAKAAAAAALVAGAGTAGSMKIIRIPKKSIEIYGNSNQLKSIEINDPQ
jgi:hypothetical protein